MQGWCRWQALWLLFGMKNCSTSHAAGEGEVDFLGVSDIRYIKRNAHPLIAHAQALHMNLSFIAASAMGLKNAEDRALDPANIVALHIERRHERSQAVILAARRDGTDHVVLQGFLGFRVLRIDDRRFAGDADRLLQAADTQLRIHVRNECTRKLNPLTGNRGEPRQSKRDAVSTGPQIDDAVPAGFIRHSRTDLFNQRWTSRLDRHTRQHSAGAIRDDTG